MIRTAQAPAPQLRAFVERVERVEEQIADLNGDKSDIYKEMRGAGFDVKTVRKIVAKRKMDATKREEADALFDLYWAELHGSGEAVSRARAHAREIIKEIATEAPTSRPEEVAAAASITPVQQPATGKSFVQESSETADSGGVSSPVSVPPRQPNPIRPHCLNPKECAGVGHKHCYSCSKAMGLSREAEVA